jgi:2-keto-3-deoxy-L-rhamnonate aldolase RhmA
MPRWPLRRNQFKEKLYRDESPLLAWLTIPWPPLAEIFGANGVDGLIIDMEHTTFDLRDVERLIVSCDAGGVAAFVRPPEIDAHLANRLLDAGASGLFFADVRTREQAEYAISCTKYPPVGRRGWGGAHTRYALWEGVTANVALRLDDDEKRGVYSNRYVTKANEDCLAFFIVESAEGTANIDSLIAVRGLNGVLFGWADYAVEHGLSLSETESAARRVYEACRSRGVPMAIPLGSIDQLPPYKGCFFDCGVDSLILSSAVKGVVEDARARVIGTKS